MSEVNYQMGLLLINFFKNTYELFPLRFERELSLHTEERKLHSPFPELPQESRIKSEEDVAREFGKKRVGGVVHFVRGNYHLIFNNYYNLFL